MPEAAEPHEPGHGESGVTRSGDRSPSRDDRQAPNGPAKRDDSRADDSGGRAQLADGTRGHRSEPAESGHHETTMDRVAGWRDAARRTARRLTGDRPDTAGHDPEHRLGGSATAHDGGAYLDEAPRRPRGRPYSRSLEFDVDWARASVFGSGLALGALIGAGIALLTAPGSGSHTRRKIADAGRRAGGRAADAWDGLGDEIRVVRAKTRRDVKRGLRGGRRDVAEALSDLDQRAMDGLRNLRDLRRSRAKEHGADARD